MENKQTSGDDAASAFERAQLAGRAVYVLDNLVKRLRKHPLAFSFVASDTELAKLHRDAVAVVDDYKNQLRVDILQARASRVQP